MRVPYLARVLFVSAAALLVAACSSSDSSRRATGADSTPVARPSLGPAPGDSACPRNGLWQPCGLVDRISKAGLSIKGTGDSARVAFLPTAGVRYRVAVTDTVLAFFFPTARALDSVWQSLDTLRVRPLADTTFAWPQHPEPMRSGNLLALYFADSPRQVERVRLAITAGPPSP